MIRAVLFDFDGLILDTETPDYESWREIYLPHGVDLPLDIWSLHIGTSSSYNPYDELEKAVGHNLDRESIRAERKHIFTKMVESKIILPGVTKYLEAAKARDLKLAVASSSSRAWVAGHLDRLKLTGYFSSILCSDDVAKVKPDPALYLKTLTTLAIQNTDAIVLEDSPNGILAAKTAGLFCAAVPNPMTRNLDISRADICLNSLDDLPLSEMLVLAESRK